ncbi:SDR family oxidoreductase [Streptomyces sp. NPDC059786]|uniref:SDR family oxidoreductase n=1 Tax=Streptomyces sp. NPDC059786 TaxID=3346946 RepID=UPI003665E838
MIGATGTVGSTVAAELEAAHQVVKASCRGPVRVDLEDPSSVDALFGEVSDLDAVVCCAASGPLADLASVSDDEFVAGVRAKLLGQVAVARNAVRHLRDGGSVSEVARAYAEAVEGTARGRTMRP